MKKLFLVLSPLFAAFFYSDIAVAAGPVIWGGNSTAKNLQQNVQTQRVLYTETGGGTDTITLQAPASITAPWTLTLPPDDGTLGDVITTDGAGVATWVDPATLLTGTANTFLGFDSLGNFGPIPQWTWNGSTYGANVSTSYDAAASQGTTHFFQTNYNPTSDTTNFWTHAAFEAVTDLNDLGDPLTGNGGVMVLQSSFSPRNAGGFGNATVMGLNSQMGNGTDPVAGYQLNGLTFNPAFADNTDLTYLRGVSVGFNAPAGAVIDNYAAFSTGNNFAEPLSGNYNAFLAGENFANVGGNLNIFSTSVNAADIAGSYSVMTATGNVGTVAQNVSGYFVNIAADSATSATAFSENSSYDVLTGNYNGFNAAPTLTDTPGANIFNSSANIPLSSNIVKIFNDGSSVTSGTDYNSAAFTPGIGTLSGYYQGINVNPTIASVVNATGIAVSMSGVTASGTNKAIQANGGDIDFSGGKFSQASSIYTPVNGGGSPGSVNLMISSVTVPASSTTANADTIGFNTAQLLNLGANSTTTSGPFGLGIATLAFPTVLTMNTGATLDHMNAAVFAVSLDPANTGGTVDEVNLARTTAIPQGGTQTLTKLRGYYADLPFGDPGTTSWGIYAKDFPNNFLEGSLRVGGTPGSSDTTTDKLQVEGNVLLQNAAGAQPQLALSEDPDNGTNKVIIQSADTLASNYTLTLPVDDGDNKQLLKTNGSGELSWAPVLQVSDAIPAGSDVPEDNDNYVYGASGNFTNWDNTSTFAQTISSATWPGELYKVGFRMRENGAYGGYVYTALYATALDGGCSCYIKTGAPLATSNQVLISSLAPYGGYNDDDYSALQEFTFDTSVTLTPATTYAIALVLVSGGGSTVALTVNSNDYAGGYGPDEGTNLTSDTNFTLHFVGAAIAGTPNNVILTNSTGHLDETFLQYEIDFGKNILGGVKQLELAEATVGGTDAVKIKSPGALSASYTLTLPVDDGTNGKVLTTDGSGVLSWQPNGPNELVKVTRTFSAQQGITTSTPADVTATALTLTSGTWDISGAVNFFPNGSGQTVSMFEVAVSLTSATIPVDDTIATPSTAGEFRVVNNITNGSVATGGSVTLAIPSYRVTLASTTTFYLVSNGVHNSNWFHNGWLEGHRAGN